MLEAAGEKEAAQEAYALAYAMDRSNAAATHGAMPMCVASLDKGRLHAEGGLERVHDVEAQTAAPSLNESFGVRVNPRYLRTHADDAVRHA